MNRGKRERRRPLNIPLTKPTEQGKTWHLALSKPTAADLSVHNRLMTRDEVRSDDLQMFVSRLEEDFLVVASFHFPFVRGRARQFKFTVPIVYQLRTEAEVEQVVDGPLVEQAVVDFEQLCMNFMSAAFPVLRTCALMLARSNPNPAPPMPDETPVSEPPDDGREEFIVNVSGGWPTARPRYNLHDVVRLAPGNAKPDVDSGYLVRAKDAEANITAWGAEYREALATYRARRAAEALAAQYRPAPTDAEAFLRSAEGASVREQIVNAFKDIADRLFPASPGPKLTRTPAKKAALVEELRASLARRLAARALRGESTAKEAVYEEMAADGYGDPPKFYSASTIKNLIGRDLKPRDGKPRSNRKRK